MFPSVQGSLHNTKCPSQRNCLPGRALHQCLPTFPSSHFFLSPVPCRPHPTAYSSKFPVEEEGKWINLSPREDNPLFWVLTSFDPGSLVSWLMGNFAFCSACWTLFIGSYFEGPHLKISARGVDFCCQKQQLLKSATYCWVIHRGSAFLPIWNTFVLPKSCLPPAWELTGFHFLLAGGELTPINLVPHSSIMASPKEIWHYPKSFSF